MAEMIKVTVNGKQIEVAYDTQLLQACREAGANVPTICHNENLKPYGVCRICSVEINEGHKTRIVPSCVYTVRKPVTVETDTPRIHKHRAMLLNLLLARTPDVEYVKKLAAEYGVTAPHERFKKKDVDCILCGMCVQTCRDVVGVAAISFEGRGATRRVRPPFDKENEMCIACGACAYVCPTQCIDFTDEQGTRYLRRWHREAPMIECDKCGRYWLPDAFQAVFNKKMGIDPATLTTCPHCR